LLFGRIIKNINENIFFKINSTKSDYLVYFYFYENVNADKL
jgi:hypothetical protein